MKIRIIVVSLLACLAVALPAVAQVSSNYDLSWHAITAGGGRIESPAGHALLGNAGQVPVGTTLAAGGHRLCSGFWCAVGQKHRIFLPTILRGYSSSTSTLIFSDNFDHGTLAGWTPNRGTWTNPGTYMRGQYGLANAWNMHSSTGSNLVYSGMVNILSGPGGGLVFRASADGTSSYDLILDTVDDVLKLSKRPPYQVLATYPLAVQYNHPYALKVVANGSTLDGYLDGAKVLSVTDSTYTDGHLGVILFLTTATYDDLEAWRFP